MTLRRVAWALWILGVLLFPVGALIARLHGPLPIPVLIFSGRAGFVVWALWAVSFAAMTVALVWLDGVPRRQAIIAQVLGGLVMVCTPILPSHDPFAYLLYGDMAAHHQDVWHPPLLSPTQDEVVSVGIIPWHNPPVPCVYGPVFVGIEQALVMLFGSHGIIALVVAQRLLSLAAVVGVSLLFRNSGVTTWALHPLVLFESAVGAHNDVLMLFIVALGLRSRLAWLAGLLLASAGMIKINALFASAFRPRTIVPMLLAVGAYVLFNHDALAVAQLAQHQNLNPLNSPIMLVRAFIRYALHHGAVSITASKVLISAAVLCSLLYLLFAPAARSIRRDRPVYATLLFIAAIPIIYSWYFTWCVFAAMLAHRTTRLTAAIICSASYLLYMQSFVSSSAKIEYPMTVLLWSVTASCVIGLILGSRRRVTALA